MADESLPEHTTQPNIQPAKLGGGKLTPEEQPSQPTGNKAEPLASAEQRHRFEDLSRELGRDDGETLDTLFGKIVPAKIDKNSIASRCAKVLIYRNF